MDSDQVSHASGSRARQGCLVEGCPCKDVRIVSRRRAAFYSDRARQHGETADRTIEPELGWRLPTTPFPLA